MSAEHVVLCGPSGSGKSTVGELVATLLGLPFFDLDREIEAAEGCTVAQLFERGESAFRLREREVAARVLASPLRSVIALGGGALEDDATLRAARGQALVLLRAPVAVLLERLAHGEERPLLRGDRSTALSRLIELRSRRYAAARHTVETDAPPEIVAARVLRAVAAGVHA